MVKLRGGQVFPRMVEVVPEGAVGSALVEHFDVTQHDSNMSAMHGSLAFVEAGRYARLMVGGKVVMSDTTMERRSNIDFVIKAEGHALVAGLGLGMILWPVLTEDPELRATVVEKNPDIIDLISPTLAQFSDRLDIVLADVFDWAPPKGTKYDAIYFDVWGDFNTDLLREMAKLHQKYKYYKRPGGWMQSWMREHLKWQHRNYQ